MMMVLALTASLLTTGLFAADTADDSTSYVGVVKYVVKYNDDTSLMVVKGLPVGFHLKSTTVFSGFQRSTVSSNAKQLSLVLKGVKVQFTMKRTKMGTMDVISIKPFVAGQATGKLVQIGQAKPMKAPSKEEVVAPESSQDGTVAPEPGSWMPEVPQVPQAPEMPVPQNR